MEHEAQVFNFGQLEEVTAGDAEFSRELLEEFVGDIPNNIDRLKAALNQGDSVSVQLEAHSIKGSSQSLGADALGQAAEVLEHSAADGTLDGWEQQFDEVMAEYDRVHETIQAYLKRAA